MSSTIAGAPSESLVEVLVDCDSLNEPFAEDVVVVVCLWVPYQLCFLLHSLRQAAVDHKVQQTSERTVVAVD